MGVQLLEQGLWVVGREAVWAPLAEVLVGAESPCVGKAAGDD